MVYVSVMLFCESGQYVFCVYVMFRLLFSILAIRRQWFTNLRFHRQRYYVMTFYVLSFHVVAFPCIVISEILSVGFLGFRFLLFTDNPV